MNFYFIIVLVLVDFSVIIVLCVYVIYCEVFCLYEMLICVDLNFDLCVIVIILFLIE